MAAPRNLKVAKTDWDVTSSRSHRIFVIKLLNYNDANDPNTVEISTFVFCGFAGSECLRK